MKGARIALVIDRLAGRAGGAERVLIRTANALAGRGHLVEIITHERPRDPPPWPLAPGVMLTRLRPARPVWPRQLDRLRGPLERQGHRLPGLEGLAWTSRHAAFWRRLARYLDAARPDAAAAFLPPAITALGLATQQLRARGVVIPALASTHNAPEQDYENPARWGPGALDRARRLAALDHFDRIAVLLEDYRDWFAPGLRPRLMVLPNAVEPAPPEARARTETARRVVAAGRLAPVKRHDLLIAAFVRIAPDLPAWRLDIHGEGPLREALAAQITAAGLQDRITLHGRTTDMGAVWRDAALMAHPAAHEGFPLAVTEALAHGLPVIGFADCSGTNALVQDGKTGLLIPAAAGSPDTARITALAEGLARLMSDSAWRAQLGAAGPTAMARFAPETSTAAWEAALLGAPPPNPAPPD